MVCGYRPAIVYYPGHLIFRESLKGMVDCLVFNDINFPLHIVNTFAKICDLVGLLS